MPPIDDSKPGLYRSHQSSFSLLQRLCDAVLIIAAEYVSCRLYPEDWDVEKTLAGTVAVIAFSLLG